MITKEEIIKKVIIEYENCKQIPLNVNEILENLNEKFFPLSYAKLDIYKLETETNIYKEVKEILKIKII